MTVADIMRTDVVTADPDTPVNQVATAMRDERVGSVVVIDERAPVGVVTDRDISTRIAADSLDPGQMTAGDMMTESPTTVEVDSGVFDLCETMARAEIRRMPVVEDGHLAGIVTLDDLTVLLAGELENLAGVIEAESPPYEAARPN